MNRIRSRPTPCGRSKTYALAPPRSRWHFCRQRRAPSLRFSVVVVVEVLCNFVLCPRCVINEVSREACGVFRVSKAACSQNAVDAHFVYVVEGDLYRSTLVFEF